MTDRNQVLITVDCLRPDHMNTYGYHRNTTPTIDSIAKQGTVFSEAYSNGPGTRWAIKSLCAGVYPLQIEGVGLPESEMTTLAEHLSQHGYKTGCFSSNGFISRGFNYGRGFDEVSDVQSLNEDTEKKKQFMIKIQEIAKYIGSSVSNNKIYNTLDKVYNQFLNQLERYEAEPLVTDDEVVQSAIDWIDSNEENEKPLFAWIHLIDAHAPYQFKPDVLSDIGASPEDIDVVRTPGNNYELELGSSPPQDLIDMYDMNVRLSDNSIEKLVSNLPDSTDIIISADHGEEFGLHTEFHSVSAFDTMARVPLIIKTPQLNVNNVQTPVGLVDIPPTICSMAGIPEASNWVGVDLCSESPHERDVYIEYNEPSQVTAAVVNDEIKYVSKRDSIEDEPTDEYLFDRGHDPNETTNVLELDEYSSDVEYLRNKINSHLRWVSENRESTPHGVWEPDSGITGERTNQVSDSVEDQLETLGYLD